MITIGCDVGGTYTDIVAFDTESKQLRVNKVPSTPDDQSVGIMNSIESIDVKPAAIDLLIHGTTVATNAVLEREGATCALLATEGFQDVLELGWRDRPNMWGLHGSYEPLIPRNMTFGIQERTAADGEIIQAIDEDEVREIGETLLQTDAEAIVVSFLHSFINPENEQRTISILKDIWPNEYLVRSSEVLPQFREFERTSSTALNAYTQPVISKYFNRLQRRLSDEGFHDDVLVMQSNGGITTAEVSKSRSVHTILSGPAAGATAASYIAKQSGYENVLACDMGGTSFDVSILPGGELRMSQKKDLEYQIPIRIPMCDINAISAGGGSVASIDEAGILHVGPESAGAEPGPVCYGKGGDQITLTDANLLLRRINPKKPIGEDVQLDLESTSDAMRTHFSTDLNLSIEESASAIIEVGVNKMVGKIREMILDQGFDPRKFSMVMFGGAGPLHGCELLAKSDIRRAIIPYYPGVLSALGCVLADARYDHVQSVNQSLDQLDIEDFYEVIAGLEDKGKKLIAKKHDAVSGVIVKYQCEMNYQGQTHSVSVFFDNPDPSTEELKEAFKEAYLQKYSELVSRPIMVDKVQVTVIGTSMKLDIEEFITEQSDTTDDAIVDEREVYFEDSWFECPIFDRKLLPHASTIEGPAIIEQDDTTTVLLPDFSARIDQLGNIVIESN